MRIAVLGVILVACLLGGCPKRGAEGASSETEPALNDRRPVVGGGGLGLGAGASDGGAFVGEWDGEFFPGLVLRIEGDLIVGTYANGEGHLEGEVYRDTIDIQFWKGAAAFNDAPAATRGIGSGKLDVGGDAIKGTYTTDMFEEGRWTITRKGTPPESSELEPEGQ